MGQSQGVSFNFGDYCPIFCGEEACFRCKNLPEGRLLCGLICGKAKSIDCRHASRPKGLAFAMTDLTSVPPFFAAKFTPSFARLSACIGGSLRPSGIPAEVPVQTISPHDSGVASRFPASANGHWVPHVRGKAATSPVSGQVCVEQQSAEC